MRYIGIIVIACFLAGCSTPRSYQAKEIEGGIEITTKAAKLFGIIPIEGVPAGKYHTKIGDKELDVDTKVDLKLIDINASKLGD